MMHYSDLAFWLLVKADNVHRIAKLILDVIWLCVRRIFMKDGAKVVCDSVSLGFLQGAKVEFEDSLMRSAFQVGEGPVFVALHVIQHGVDVIADVIA